MPRKIVISNFVNFAERYIAGESENKLASEAGIARECFRRHLIDAGINPRNQSESEKSKWNRMTQEQRKQQVKSAHDAVRGVPLSHNDKIAQALGKQSKKPNTAIVETILADALRSAGYRIMQQRAIGYYNVDIAFDAFPVAVEVFGGGWHSYGRHAERFTKRTINIFNHGWSLLIVWVDAKRFPLTNDGINKVASFYEFSRLDPSSLCKYGMIRGNGDGVPIGSKYFNDAPAIKTLSGSPNFTDRQHILTW